MKILFVISGNKCSGISTIIRNQGISLSKLEIEIEYFPVKGKGILGYISNIPRLKKLIKTREFDVVHAHYSYSGFLASLAGAKQLIVSLMGSDLNGKKINKSIIRSFCFIFRWKRIIVKSLDMKNSLGLRNAEIVANGVDVDHFKPINTEQCREKLGWDVNKKHLLFTANPDRFEKNFLLAEKSFHLINNENVFLHVLNNVPYNDMPFWLNAADVILLTSFWEGSPNVIKEAMACNRPIVSTAVGDIKWLFGQTNGCYISDFDQIRFSEKIREALDFGSRTNGRQRIMELGLDARSIAFRLSDIYKSVQN